MTASDTLPQDFSLNLAASFWLTRAVWLAARLRLADAVGDGPTDLMHVANQTRTDPYSLCRLMHALSAESIFRRDAQGRFAPTPTSSARSAVCSSSERYRIAAGRIIVPAMSAIVSPSMFTVLKYWSSAISCRLSSSRWLSTLYFSKSAIASGLSNVVLDWPIVAALGHSAGAAALVGVLGALWARWRTAPQAAMARSAEWRPA